MVVLSSLPLQEFEFGGFMEGDEESLMMVEQAETIAAAAVCC